MSTKRILTVWGVVFIVVMVCLMVFGQTAMKISQYPNTNTLGPNQLFLVTAGATNMNVKASDMPSALSVPTLAQMYGVGANLTGLVYSVGANTTNFAKSITNGDLYISGHLTVQSNLTVNGTNSTTELEAGTLTVSNDIVVNGGASFGAAVTSSANSASNGPAANEFPNASWVRGLFNNGQLLYAGPGQRTDATNVSSGQIMYLFTNNIPPTSSRKYATVNAGDYIGSVMTSNSLKFLQGPIYVHAYLQSSNGNGGQSVSVHPEIYYSYDRTNWLGDFTANDQVLAQNTNLYEWVLTFPAVTSTNATGFWVERRFKVGAASGATHPDVYFHLGTNYLTSSNDASHIAFSGPSSEVGLVGSNGTLYAAGTINFVGNTKMTNVNGTMSVDVTPGTGGGTSTSNNIPGDGTYWQAGTNFVLDTGATNLFRITLTQNSGLMLTNGIDGQTMTIQVTQDGTGGWGLVTNQVGTCGYWNFGTDITGWSITTNAGKTDYIRAQYWKASNRWDVVGYVRGY